MYVCYISIYKDYTYMTYVVIYIYIYIYIYITTYVPKYQYNWNNWNPGQEKTVQVRSVNMSWVVY